MRTRNLALLISKLNVSDINSNRRPSKLVTIFCDGSSLGNGREVTRAAAVALLGYQGLWRAFGISLGKATQSQAEIFAPGPRPQNPTSACTLRTTHPPPYHPCLPHG